MNSILKLNISEVHIFINLISFVNKLNLVYIMNITDYSNKH